MGFIYLCLPVYLVRITLYELLHATGKLFLKRLQGQTFMKFNYEADAEIDLSYYHFKMLYFTVESHGSSTVCWIVSSCINLHVSKCILNINIFK